MSLRPGACLVACVAVVAMAGAQDLPVPHPPLDGLEPVVAQQIREAVEAAIGAPDRTRGEAWGLLGMTYHAYEFTDAAAASYEIARRVSPRDYRWAHLLAALREQTGDFEAAVDHYLAALRLEPADHAAGVQLGHVLLQLDRLGEARSRFESARARFPASAASGLADIALRERRFTDAIVLFEDVLRRAPQATRARYGLGMAYRGAGRLTEAQAQLAMAGRGRVRAADPLVDALPTLVRGFRALLNRARIEIETGEWAAGAAMFARALASAPDDMDEDATIDLALQLADRQLFTEAVGVLSAAFVRFPQRDATATTLARLLAASPDRAVRDGTRALEIATRVHERRPTPAHAETVALALAELGRCEDAAEWMRQAVEMAEKAGDAAETARLRAPRNAARCGN